MIPSLIKIKILALRRIFAALGSKGLRESSCQTTLIQLNSVNICNTFENIIINNYSINK